MSTGVHLGFAVGSGEPVAIPMQHLAVTGQTQLSGKTTTLEALVTRSGRSAIAFITKRMEATFDRVHTVMPYFRERADWQFVSAVLEATMRERLKFERSWIMRASKGAQTLADVQQNVRRAMVKARGLSADVYMVLDHYLDIVIPQISRLHYASTLTLAPGINVMDLSAYSTELQALVIRSVIEWVYECGRDVLVIIPEAWEFIPQNRGSPVLLACEQLIRKGGAAHNYVWLDSLPGYETLLVRINGLVSVETFESLWALGGVPARGPKGEEAITFMCPVDALADDHHALCWRPVKGMLRHPFIGELIKLNTVGGTLDVSGNHPVMTGQQGRSASHLQEAERFKIGDTVASRAFEKMTKEGGRALAGDQPLFIGSTDLAWFYGLFCADGWINRDSVCIANSKEKHLAHAVEIIQRYFHLSPCSTTPRDGVATIEVRSPKLVKHLRDVAYLRGSASSRTRTVPRMILNAPPAIQTAWLDGYIDGDGHRRANNEIKSVCASSRALLLGLTYLMRGHTFSCHLRDDQPDVVQLTVGASHRRDRAAIKAANRKHYEGALYDLVDVGSSDHTYYAGIGNLRISNSQDIAGVHKNILRQVGVWILGVQREANEVKRTLAHIPGAKPKLDDVMQLELGQFFACYGRVVVKVYVQPAWMDMASARDIALGRAHIIERHPPTAATWPIKPDEEETVTPQEATALREQNEQLKVRVRTLEEALAELRASKLPHDETPPARPERLVPRMRGGYQPAGGGERPPAPTTGSGVTPPKATINGVDLDALYAAIKLKALTDPDDAKLLAILRHVPEVEVTRKIERIKLDASTQPGLLAAMIAEGYFEQAVETATIIAELKRRGRSIHHTNVYRDLSRLAAQGFLTKEPNGYQAVPGMKVHIVEE